MKRTQLYFISAAILSLLLLACAGKQAKGENGIVGKWKFAKMTGDVVASDSLFTSRMMNLLNGDLPTGPDGKVNIPIFEFKENGIMDNDGTPGTYSVEGDKLRIRGGERIEFVKFNIKDDTLLITLDYWDDHYQNEKELLKIPDSVEVEKYLLNLFFVKEK